MGFLTKAIGKAVVEKAGEVAMYVVVYEENTRSVDVLVNKSTANYMLFIKKKSMSVKRGFTVCDRFDKKKYGVKTDALTFGYPCIRLYDVEEDEIGKVELSSKTGMRTYAIYLDGKNLVSLLGKWP